MFGAIASRELARSGVYAQLSTGLHHPLHTCLGRLRLFVLAVCADHRVEAHCVWLYSGLRHRLKPCLARRGLYVPGARAGLVARTRGINCVQKNSEREWQ